MKLRNSNVVSPKVLVVDDEERVLGALRRSFNHLDPDLVLNTVSRSREAIKVIESVPVDLVISDLRMPDKDGTAVLQAVRRTQPNAVRVILSGQASTEQLMAALPSSHRYVEKPCSTNHLRAILDLYQALCVSELPPALVKQLLSFSKIPVDALLCKVLRKASNPGQLTHDMLPLTADLGLHLSIIRLGVIVYGQKFCPTALPIHLLHPLLESQLLLPLLNSPEIQDGFRLVSIKAKLLEHRLMKRLDDPRYAGSVAARAYLGEYVLLSIVGTEREFVPFIQKHSQEVGQVMGALWGLPPVLSEIAQTPVVNQAQNEINQFLPLQDLDQLSSKELLSMLSEVLCSNLS